MNLIIFSKRFDLLLLYYICINRLIEKNLIQIDNFQKILTYIHNNDKKNKIYTELYYLTILYCKKNLEKIDYDYVFRKEIANLKEIKNFENQIKDKIEQERKITIKNFKEFKINLLSSINNIGNYNLILISKEDYKFKTHYSIFVRNKKYF
jgi:hypothetical protein